MTCRACGNEERASEGYPCADCGTFVCLICSMRGTVRCRSCEETQGAAGDPAGPRAGSGGPGEKDEA